MPGQQPPEWRVGRGPGGNHAQIALNVADLLKPARQPPLGGLHVSLCCDLGDWHQKSNQGKQHEDQIEEDTRLSHEKK